MKDVWVLAAATADCMVLMVGNFLCFGLGSETSAVRGHG